jgi:hypothetical protein
MVGACLLVAASTATRSLQQRASDGPLNESSYAPIPLHRAGKYVSLEFAIFLASDQHDFQRKLFPQLVNMRVGGPSYELLTRPA